MTDINDILSRCTVQLVNVKDASEADFWVFTLDNPTGVDIADLRDELQKRLPDGCPKCLVWRDTLHTPEKMGIQEAIALRDILNDHIQEWEKFYEVFPPKSVAGG